MERRLIEAAKTGDVLTLLNLVKDDPLLLRAVTLAGGQTPLHIACIAGHLNFVEEIIKLRREFAREFNHEGFSPLHIASANGELDIVKELLKIDQSLCKLKGRERRIPLHYAAIRGRVHVMEELLLVSVDSIEEVTARGENALHLAVKNNQFDSFIIMVEHLKEFNLENALNMKDVQGNTILHLAASQKQFEVFDLVLNEKVVAKGKLEVNSLNKNGLTPLDVLLMEGGDKEIEEILRLSSGKRAEDLQSSTQTTMNQNQFVDTNSPSNDPSRRQQSRPSPSKQLQDYFKYNKFKDSPSEVRNTLLVIAILILTATYQAVLSPPGGVWQGDSSSDPNSKTNNTGKYITGKALMGYSNVTFYGLFLVFNSIGFFMAIYMISFLTVGFPLQFELQVSIAALIVTYDSSMTAITPNSRISLCFTIISIAIPLIIPIVTRVVRNYLRPRYMPPCELPGTV